MSRAETASRPSAADRATPVLDARFFDFILDSLACLQAFICSCIEQMPYASLRDTFCLQGEEREQIVEAAEALAYTHQDSIREHGGPAILLTTLMAAQVARLDAILTADPDFGQFADSREARWQLLWGLVFVFLPVLPFGLIFQICTWSGKR